jgi:hypothetical protein
MVRRVYAPDARAAGSGSRLRAGRTGSASRSEKETGAGAPSCRLVFCLSLPGGVLDGRARLLILSFGLRRAPQGAGLVAAAPRPATPLLPEHPPHQSFPPATVTKRACGNVNQDPRPGAGSKTLAVGRALPRASPWPVSDLLDLEEVPLVRDTL